MRKLLAVLLLLATPALAQAPTVSPGLQYFEGPTIGERWEGAGLYQFGAGFNAQSGTTYTVVAADMGKFLTFSNAGAQAVTLPQAGTAGFEAFQMLWHCLGGGGDCHSDPDYQHYQWGGHSSLCHYSRWSDLL
jgi:hypothetical protein